MKTIKGPAIFLAQFIGDEAPFNRLETLAEWASRLGYIGIQLPTNIPGIFDLETAAKSKTYCDEVAGICKEKGVVITELSTHLQGQLIAVHPAYADLFAGFAPPNTKGNVKAMNEWATEQLVFAAKASSNLGLNAHVTFSGALLWHTVYPWPQRPAGLVDAGFTELAKRWTPVLNAFDNEGVDVCYEIHPGEDLHDGISYELFLEKVNNHERACLLYDPSHFVLQCLNYLDFLDIYHERIKMFHVKDAEFNPTGRQGVYGGYQNWVNRAGRFRSPGDGQVDFKSIFSKFAQYNYDGWAVLEWECALKHPEDGAAEGAVFIKENIIRVTEKAFDDFASSGGSNENFNNQILGIV